MLGFLFVMSLPLMSMILILALGYRLYAVGSFDIQSLLIAYGLLLMAVWRIRESNP